MKEFYREVRISKEQLISLSRYTEELTGGGAIPLIGVLIYRKNDVETDGKSLYNRDPIHNSWDDVYWYTVGNVGLEAKFYNELTEDQKDIYFVIQTGLLRDVYSTQEFERRYKAYRYTDNGLREITKVKLDSYAGGL